MQPTERRSPVLLSERLAQVYAGPDGPHVAAFFDFDGTVIHGFSAVDFYLHRMGHTVVLASSATRFQLEAAARTLGIDHVLSTALEAGEDGILTGRADGPTLWRAGKARAIREFGAAHEIDLEASYAYSNGNEDID